MVLCIAWMRLPSEHLADTQSTGAAAGATAADTRLDVRTTRGASTGLLFCTVEKMLALLEDLTTRGAGRGLLQVLKTLAGETDRATRDGLEPLEDASLDAERLDARKGPFGDDVNTPWSWVFAYCTVRERPLLTDLAATGRVSMSALAVRTVTRRGQLEERAGEEVASPLSEGNFSAGIGKVRWGDARGEARLEPGERTNWRAAVVKASSLWKAPGSGKLATSPSSTRCKPSLWAFSRVSSFSNLLRSCAKSARSLCRLRSCSSRITSQRSRSSTSLRCSLSMVWSLMDRARAPSLCTFSWISVNLLILSLAKSSSALNCSHSCWELALESRSKINS